MTILPKAIEAAARAVRDEWAQWGDGQPLVLTLERRLAIVAVTAALPFLLDSPSPQPSDEIMDSAARFATELAADSGNRDLAVSATRECMDDLGLTPRRIEAHLTPSQTVEDGSGEMTDLRALAAVRAEEREACAREREACARVAEETKLSPRKGPAFARSSDPGKMLGAEIAAAIRERGSHE